MATRKAVVLHKFLNSHEELRDCIETFQPPDKLQPNEIEVDVRAIAINFAVGVRYACTGCL